VGDELNRENANKGDNAVGMDQLNSQENTEHFTGTFLKHGQI